MWFSLYHLPKLFPLTSTASTDCVFSHSMLIRCLFSPLFWLKPRTDSCIVVKHCCLLQLTQSSRHHSRKQLWLVFEPVEPRLAQRDTLAHSSKAIVRLQVLQLGAVLGTALDLEGVPFLSGFEPRDSVQCQRR